MSSTVNRRALLKGVATGAIAVGFSQAAGGWLNAASAKNVKDVSWAPTFDGTLETASDVLANFSKDFGNLRSGTPRAVLRPGSVEDIVKAVRFARSNRLTIAMNGQSGTGNDRESHSNYGQAHVPGGISIDARSLNRIHRIDSHCAVVDAGVTWSELNEAALAHGRTPPALPDYLHLTIGGTVSVGGIGGTVQKYGLLCDTIEEIDVVTGTGHLVTASLWRNRSLFLAVLAGGGQCGLIVRARVKLIPAPSSALIFNLFYDDLATYREDAERVMADGRFDHQAGEIVAKPDGSGWRYKLEVGRFYTGAEPDRDALLSGLRDERAAMTVLQLGYRDWVTRLDPYEVYLKEVGLWEQPKPWLSLVLPASRTQEFITAVVRELTPGDLGAGFAGLYPFPTAKLTRPLFAKPSERTAYLFDLLRFPFPGDGIERMLDQNRRFFDLGVSLGAKRYLVGAIPDMTPTDWRRHFGVHWSMLASAKYTYDPDRILTPGQGFFA